MTTDMPHQRITRAIGGTVAVVIIRDPASGDTRFAVSYENRGGAQRWLSKDRFGDIEQATAAGLVLSDFLGATYR